MDRGALWATVHEATKSGTQAEHKEATAEHKQTHTPPSTPCVGLDEADPILGCPDQLA